MFYVGLDVSVGRTSVCIMDAIGQVVREQSVASTGGNHDRYQGDRNGG
jgi:hypothetical protein